MSSPRRIRLAAFSFVALLSPVLALAPAAAQDGIICMGMDPATAEAEGFRVQIGTDGTDVLTGGNTTRDYIVGLGGDDALSGAGAGDIICGGDGNDIISSGTGDDAVDGGAGDDEINLSSGDDVGLGGDGRDHIIGGSGNDELDGGIGADRISGEDGDDTIYGRGGKDTIFGGRGRDFIRGGGAGDKLAGGPGGDNIRGERGADIISGDDGRDKLRGGAGNDVLSGDTNIDLVIGGSGTDRCNAGSDRLRTCEQDLTGEPLTPPEPVTPEPETPVDPQPPAGDPVPADQAPQGTNQFGWPLLTDVGLEALAICESGGRYDINTGNGFYGAVQWLPATWESAARQSGFEEHKDTLPHLVAPEVQDAVAKWWWGATRPNTQWPHCHVLAMEAMNVLPPA